MATYRKHSERSTAWIQAVIFNGLLIILPIVAARVVAVAFATGGIGVSPTPEALKTTRENIDTAFERMARSGDDARGYWASLVEQELNNKDLSAARGFLLAAPQLLDRETRQALREMAKVEGSGSADARLAKSALRYLPNVVRSKYESAQRPPRLAVMTVAEEGTEPEVEPGTEEGTEPTTEPALVREKTFTLLGDAEDLAANSRRWINGDESDSFVLRLTGLSMAQPDVPETVNLVEAASILKGAHRAGRLTPRYRQLLKTRLDNVIPERELKPRLEEALGQIAPMNVLGERVTAAFEASIDVDELPKLMAEIDMINRIANATSPTSTIGLLEVVRSHDDLRRLSLVTDAGGDRAAALVKHIDDDALDLARSGIKMTRPLILQIMLLASLGLALLLAFLSALQRLLSDRPRKAAIY